MSASSTLFSTEDKVPNKDKINKPYSFTIKGLNSVGVIERVRNPHGIDKEEAKSVLVESFIGEYKKYLAPNEICDSLTSWRDGDKSVQKYYENYFKTELEDFSCGNLHYWFQATINGKVVGWATFQREKSDQNSVYMNLLVVHPEYQSRGIGGQLVNALVNLHEIPNLNAIHLLLRKKNRGGREFYLKLGFAPDPEYQREDNFVNLDLLEGFTWRNPSLQNKQHDPVIKAKPAAKAKAAEVASSSKAWVYGKYLVAGLAIAGIGLFALHLKSKGSSLTASDGAKLQPKL